PTPEPARAPEGAPEGAPGPRRDPDTAADGGGARPEGDDPSGRTADPEPSPAPPAPAPVRPGARTRPGAEASADAARALLVPVPAAEAVPEPRDAPGTVLPGVPEAARPRVRAPQPAGPVPQGPPCPACGTPNPPLRTFCRACASRLAGAQHSDVEGPFAGQRPRLDRGRNRWAARVLVVTGLALLLVGGVIGGPPAVRAVQDHFAKRVAVRPTGWSASHSGPGHGPELVFDGYSNTWWGTGYAGDSNGQHLQADFAQPVDLLAVLVTPGTSKRPGQAADQARPQEVDLVVTDSAGRTKTVHKTLDDGGVQRVEVRRRDAVSVRIVLRSAYGAGADRQVAVAEVEFFGRSRT
ncbi:NADase-type glycan-binding domain-containing protein, partial [Streptomyces toxytricini]|uniref:discoidin domain-containing protein n=1 Tax=Streptomyces toxytricini TaxID=67369 RepID=UPI00347C1400